MPKFNFQIDKKTCFAHWAQFLVNWDTSFNFKEYEYYSKIDGALKKNETQTLAQFKKILQKKGNGDLWLWQRYRGEKIKNAKEQKIWHNIKKNLRKKFEKTWQKEINSLEKWRDFFQRYNYNDVRKVLNDIERFFGVSHSLPDEVIVKLVFRHNKKIPTGSTMREYNDVLLGINNLYKIYFSRAVGVLIHELTHKIENASPISNHLTGDSYARIILPYRIPAADRKWRYLFAEPIVASIAGFPYDNNYTQKKIFRKSDKAIAYSQNMNDYRIQMRIIAQKIAPLTAKYLHKGKTMDKKFCDTVAKKWLKLKQSI